LLLEALAELSTSLVELGMSGEELNRQNEELIETRQQVEAERSHYKELFEFTPDGYLVTDANATIPEANRATATLLGVRQDFLIGKPLIVFIAEGEHDKFLSWLSQAGKSERANLELTIQPRDGKPFPVELTVTGIYERNEHTGLRWLVRDISKHKQVEAALHESEERFHTLATVAPVGIFLSDPQGNCTYANPRWLQMVGLSLEEVLGDGWMNAIYPEDRQRVINQWSQYCRNPEIWNEEYRLQTPQGQVTWVSGIAAPMP
jgi:PAS domain S-box-containing protein